MSLLDGDQFNYVTKRYEDEIKATAKKLMFDDSVNKTLANINAKLDSLIKELNAKYEFMQRKVYGEGGVDDFVRASHIEIDGISVDTKDFISEEIKNTKSHPSINAFKENRNFSAYKSLDFINKSIHLNTKTLGLSFSDNGLKDTDKMHTFRINLASDETLKIVEFSITYRQDPKVVNIINKVVMKESTVQIERVIKGKFFIIRPNLQEPQNIIVKAIIENSDNTSNVINEQVIDVKSSKDANNSIIRDGIGPEFDLYFKVASINELDICIGKIIPYKWMIEKEYIVTGAKSKSAFSLVKTSPETNIHIDKVLYSKATNKFFVVDNTNRTVYITENPELDPKDFTIYPAIVYTENINIINVGVYTILTNGLTSIVFANDPLNYKDLGFNTRSAKIVSTGELLIDQNGDNLCVVNTNTFTPTIITDFGVPNRPGILGDTGFIEYEPGVLITFGVLDSKVYYKTINVNVNNANYRENSIVSIVNTYDIEKLIGWDTESTKIHVFRAYNDSISLIVSAKKLDNRVITVGINFNNIVYATASIDFKDIKELPYFDVETQEQGVLTKFFDKIVQTTLFDFGITSDKKLFIIDKDFIYDAIRFTPVYEKVKYIDEATYSEMYRDEFRGYSLKNSILYCEPEENEAELFNSNTKFLQNIVGVYESKNGIFICDRRGVYELCNNKNLKTRFYITTKNDEDTSFIDNVVTDVDDEIGIIVYKNGTNNFIVHHSFNGVDSSEDKKIRFKYTDLYNEEWQAYSEDQELYESDKKIIDFQGKLFISFVDRMSNINNTNVTKTIIYSEDLNTYKDVNPFATHKQTFLLETGSAAKDVPVTKFVLRANKYGIVNYHGFETFNTSANISDVNKIKSYILVHKPKDGLTLDDYRKVIMQKLKEEALLDKNADESYKTYEYDKDSPSSKKRVFEMNPESFDTDSKLLGSVSFSGVNFEFTESKLIYRNNLYNLPVSGKLIAVKAIDIGIFFLVNKDNTTIAYYLTRDEFKANFSNAPYTFFTDVNRVMIGERVQFPSVTNVRNDNWVEHYVSGNINAVFIALGKTVYGYYVRNPLNGKYSKPFSNSEFAFEVKRDDSTDDELNKSDLNCVKIIDEDLFFWNNTGSYGLYRFDNASPNKTMVVIDKQYIGEPVIDIIRNPNKRDQFFLATDAKNSNSTCFMISYTANKPVKIYSDEARTTYGCANKFVQCGENFFIGSYNRVIMITDDYKTVAHINIDNSQTIDFLYTVQNINGEIIAYTPDNKSSVGFYKIDEEDYECSFSKIDVNSTNTIKYNINSIVQILDNSFKVFVDCENNLVNSVKQFQFYSPNPVDKVVRTPIQSSDNKRLTLGFYKTMANGDSVGLGVADDAIIVNTEMSNNKIDKFFFNQPSYSLIDKTTVSPDVDGGRWVENDEHVEKFVPNSEFFVLDGDATVWSPYSFKNLEVLKINNKIKVFEFVPNDIATYEKIDTTKTKRPIPEFNYYTKNIHGNYDLISNLTQFEKNEIYYRRSGCWRLVTSNALLSANKVFYYSEDLKFVKAGIDSTRDTSIDNNTTISWSDALSRENINVGRTQNFGIENDIYEIWKCTHTNNIYRQSFANSEYPIKDARFINGFLECGESEIALPVIIRDSIQNPLTGNEDPYALTDPFTKTQAESLACNTLFKSLIHNYSNVQEVSENSPYSVFPIYKIFNTSAGKFVIYKQDYRYNDTDIVNKYSLGIISNDYKQITKIIFANTILNPENVFVFEPKDKSRIFVIDNNLGYCYLFDKNRGTINEFSLSSAKFTYMFIDDDNAIVGIDTKSITKKFSAYKFNSTTSEWEKFFENNTDVDPFTAIDDGFVIRVGREDVNQHLLIGNGEYCAYRYVKTGFVPVLSELSSLDVTVLKASIDANNNLLLKLRNNNNTPNNNITLEIDKDYKIKYLLIDNWGYYTGVNDKYYPDMYFTNGANSFFKMGKTVIENTEHVEFTPQLIELPLVTTLPIEHNGVLYFNNCKANELNLKEDHKTNYVLYDVDGLNILTNHAYFSKMFKTNDHGIFGITKNAVFRNDVDSNGNGFIKVGDVIAGSEYVNIIETNYGLFFVDDKTVKKFNETTKKFEVVEQDFTTGTVKINFIKQFNEGLFIASKVERLNNPSQYGVKDITAPAKFYWYNPMTGQFVDIFDLSSEYNEWKFGYNDHITDIKQTSIGVFIVVNKSLENIQNNENLSTAFDYSQVECKTYLIYNNGKVTPLVTKVNVLPGTIENPNTIVTPVDATSIFETEDGDIFLYGHAWYHNVSNAATSTTFTRLQLVKITEPVTEQQKSLKTYYRWVVSADETEFGQNIIGKTKMYDKSDGSEELIDTFYGPFLVRTSRSLQKGRGLNIIKLDKVPTNINTEFGEKLTGFIKDVGDTKALNIPPEAAVKLCQIGSRIFAFKYINGNITCAEYDVKTGGFTTEYNFTTLDILNRAPNDDYVDECDVMIYNGVLFFKIFNQIYRFGDWKLKYTDSIGDKSIKFKDEVLYDLKIVFENNDFYNNLPEETDNSEIDKFVIKEVGIINPLKTKEVERIDQYGNVNIEEVPDEDPNSDIFRHVTQMFMPHNYYNRSDGRVDKLMDNSEPSSGVPKEFIKIKNLKQLYKYINKGTQFKNLINSRFLVDKQTEVSDMFVHKTNQVLGDIEKYIKNTDCFRIELRIYPTECTADAKDIYKNTTSFADFSSLKDNEMIKPFTPEC